MSYATFNDVSARMGAALPSDVARVDSLLQMANGLVSVVIGGRVYDDGDVPDVVRAVAVSVVERALRNPEGLQQESAGPFSRTRFASQGGMYLTAEEKALLLSVIGRTGVMSVRTPVTDAHLEAVRAFGRHDCSQIAESDEDDGS